MNAPSWPWAKLPKSMLAWDMRHFIISDMCASDSCHWHLGVTAVTDTWKWQLSLTPKSDSCHWHQNKVTTQLCTCVLRLRAITATTLELQLSYVYVCLGSRLQLQHTLIGNSALSLCAKAQGYNCNCLRMTTMLCICVLRLKAINATTLEWPLSYVSVCLG